jgi:predicted transcriptional regulator
VANTKSMTLRLDQDTALALQALAQVESIPIAEAARTAIEDHIERKRKDQAFQERRARLMEENRQILDRLA